MRSWCSSRSDDGTRPPLAPIAREPSRVSREGHQRPTFQLLSTVLASHPQTHPPSPSLPRPSPRTGRAVRDLHAMLLQYSSTHPTASGPCIRGSGCSYKLLDCHLVDRYHQTQLKHHLRTCCPFRHCCDTQSTCFIPPPHPLSLPPSIRFCRLLFLFFPLSLHSHLLKRTHRHSVPLQNCAVSSTRPPPSV